MRFLIDMPVSPRVAAWLVEQGHDAVHAMAVGLGRASDREVLDRALQDNRLVVTADTDFPQLLTLAQAKAPGVILFREATTITPLDYIIPRTAGKGLAADNANAGPGGKQLLEPAQDLGKGELCPPFRRCSRSESTKANASMTMVTWWCQPAQPLPSKWSSPR